MLLRSLFVVAGVANTVSATNLYVSSYIGTITTISLEQSSEGKYSLQNVSVNLGSLPNPSWDTLDRENRVVYCVDENLSGGNGSVASYSTSSSGTLTRIDRHATLGGPVHSAVYNHNKSLALAH